MEMPKWFVQTEDKRLHGYYTAQVLLCDLAANRGENVTILELDKGWRTQYRPITEADLRAKIEARVS